MDLLVELVKIKKYLIELKRMKVTKSQGHIEVGTQQITVVSKLRNQVNVNLIQNIIRNNNKYYLYLIVNT